MLTRISQWYLGIRWCASLSAGARVMYGSSGGLVVWWRWWLKFPGSECERLPPPCNRILVLVTALESDSRGPMWGSIGPTQVDSVLRISQALTIYSVKMR